jgi:hypothetical protein
MWFILGNGSNTGVRNITGIEFKAGYVYISGNGNKAGQLNASHRNGESQGWGWKINLCSSFGIRVCPDGG